MCASQNTCPPSWYGVWLHGHWGQVQWGHWTCSWEHRENKLQLVYVLHMLRGPTEVYCWDTRPRGSRPHHASCSEEPREPCLVRHIRPAEVSSSGFPCWATVCLSLFLTQLLTFTYWLVFYRVAFQLDIIIWQEELNVSVFGIFAKTLLNPAIWKCSCAQKVVGHRIFGVQTSRQGRRTCASISSSRTTCCLLLLVYAYKPHTLQGMGYSWFLTQLMLLLCKWLPVPICHQCKPAIKWASLLSLQALLHPEKNKANSWAILQWGNQTQGLRYTKQ